MKLTRAGYHKRRVLAKMQQVQASIQELTDLIEELYHEDIVPPTARRTTAMTLSELIDRTRPENYL